jgi:hypothetical protein
MGDGVQMMKDGQKKVGNISDKSLGWMSVRLQEDTDATPLSK